MTSFTHLSITSAKSTVAILLLFWSVSACSTTTPMVTESTSEDTNLSLFRVKVQVVEVDSVKAIEALQRQAISKLRTNLDQAMESERESLRESYPEISERAFILELRKLPFAIDEKDMTITIGSVTEQNGFWVARGEAEVNPTYWITVLRENEGLWRVFQHSEWIQTLQETP